jgi:hypothetical protein
MKSGPQDGIETWDAIEAFNKIPGAWTMELEGGGKDGWWAYYNDEEPIGPFALEHEAARAGLKAWGTPKALVTRHKRP